MSDDHTPCPAPESPPLPAATTSSPGRVREAGDLDSALARPGTRRLLAQGVPDHDAAGAAACQRCGWSLSVARRECPSRVIAYAVLGRRPVPRWFSALAHAVAGAVTKRPSVSTVSRDEAEDAQLGLFPAPPRRMRPAAGEGGSR